MPAGGRSRGRKGKAAPLRSQFLRDMAAAVTRMANIAANPYWEGEELTFTAVPDGDGLRLEAARLGRDERVLAECRLGAADLREEGGALAGRIEAWVQALPLEG